MKAKILFLDDIFSDLFRKQLSQEHLALDESWVSSVTYALGEKYDNTGITFELIKAGNIDDWASLIRTEKPDVLLLDLFWPEEALQKYGDRARGSDISLEIIPQIRKFFSDLPIVCYTVKPDRELLEEAYHAGATFFLEKVPLALPEAQTPLKYILIWLLRNLGKKL